MRYIVETQGQPPGKILDSGLKTAFYFDAQLYFTTSTWKLKVLSTLQLLINRIFHSLKMSNIFLTLFFKKIAHFCQSTIYQC